MAWIQSYVLSRLLRLLFFIVFSLFTYFFVFEFSESLCFSYVLYREHRIVFCFYFSHQHFCINTLLLKIFNQSAKLNNFCSEQPWVLLLIPIWNFLCRKRQLIHLKTLIYMLAFNPYYSVIFCLYYIKYFNMCSFLCILILWFPWYLSRLVLLLKETFISTTMYYTIKHVFLKICVSFCGSQW